MLSFRPKCIKTEPCLQEAMSTSFTLIFWIYQECVNFETIFSFDISNFARITEQEYKAIRSLMRATSIY